MLLLTMLTMGNCALAAAFLIMVYSQAQAVDDAQPDTQPDGRSLDVSPQGLRGVTTPCRPTGCPWCLRGGWLARCGPSGTAAWTSSE